MGRLTLWPAVLGLALAMIVVDLVAPVAHSLSYASGAIVLIGLLGWVIEAREVAGPAPEVEPEHEEEEEAPGPSYWPIVLALGIVGIAAGLIYGFQHGALIVALPLAAGSAAGWANALKREMAVSSTAVTVSDPLSAQPASVGGRILAPVPPRALAAQAAGGAAIAIERVAAPPITRRNILRITFWAGFFGALGAAAASMVDMLYPRDVKGFGGVVSPGLTDSFPPGSKSPYAEGRFWLVNLTAEQGGPGYLALWWKCPHLGCTVPWKDDFVFTDPTTNTETRGWFRCPCHGSTYNNAGVRVFGPAPRSMDHFDLTIDPSSKRISVNTGKVTKGTTDNAKFAVKG